MQIRFLLGPAGSGKTFRCLAEIREALLAAPEGPPLILLAPKQATFQLERQLLDFPGRGERLSRHGGDPRKPLTDASASSPGVSPHRKEVRQLEGYTRLRILSFERLAEFVFSELRLAPPDLLSEQGRIMVLRALLARERNALELFHATARLPGFARELSLQIREFQRYQFSPATLRSLAAHDGLRPELQAKLRDLALLFDAYLRWLEEHRLDDVYRLPDLAAEALRNEFRVSASESRASGSELRVAGLWLDGFAEMTPQ